VVLLAVWGLILAASPKAVAEEPAAEFLEGLRNRGYTDVALDYLERMKDSPLAPREFRKYLDYEWGKTLLTAARMEHDREAREKLFNEAQDKLRNFVGANPQDPKAEEATQMLSTVIVERARSAVAEAQRSHEPAEKTAALERARKFYDQAHAAFNHTREDLKNRILALPKQIAPTQKDLLELQEDLRARYVQVVLFSAKILHEKADTFEDGSSPAGKQAYKAAQEAYKELFEKYRRKLAGLYARLWMGKCEEMMGNYDEALTIYREMMEQPEKPDPFRDLRTETVLYIAQCLLKMPENDETKKLRAKFVEDAPVWIGQARPNEDRDANWISLRFHAAELYHEHAKSLPKGDAKIAKLDKDARTLLRQVIKYPSEHKKPAQSLLADLGAGGQDEGPGEPTNFYEARDFGKQALAIVQGENVKLKKLEQQAAVAKGEEKQKLTDAVTKLRKTVATNKEKAIDYFRQSLAMVDENVEARDVNVVRYYLCYLYYLDQRYYDAAVMGEFIARRYPFALGAKDCGNIALASYRKLYLQEKEAKEAAGDAAEQDPSPYAFELRKSIEVGQFLVKQWPENTDNDNTGLILVSFSLKLDDTEQAEKFVELIGETSEKRGTAELLVGQTLWADYLMLNASVRKMQERVNELKESLKELAPAAAESPPTDSGELVPPGAGTASAPAEEGGNVAAEEPETAEAPDAVPTATPVADPAAGLGAGPTQTPADETAAEPPVETSDEPASEPATDADNSQQQNAITAEIKRLEADIAGQQETLLDLRNRAQRLLVSGIERLKGGEITSRLSLGVLSLAQLYVEADQPMQAVTWLEDEKIGVLELVRKEHESTKRERFAEETFKIALRAYIGALPLQSDSAAADRLVAQAEAAMNDLRSVVVEQKGGEEKLLNTYISLAKSIENKLRGSDPEVRRALSKGFDTFLTRIAGQEDVEPRYLFWAAETFFTLGKNLDTGAEPSAEAVAFYKKSGETFSKLLDRAKTDKDIDNNMQQQIRLRLAETSRLGGNYEQAIEHFAAILKQKEMMLNVQISAAETFEDWGAEEPEQYDQAIFGYLKKPDGKPIVWGWIRMAYLTASHPQHRNTFYLARFHVAYCLYQKATRIKDQAERSKLLGQAKSSIETMYSLYPSLGGEELTHDGKPVDIDRWGPQYDELLKKIQREKGEEPVGLKAFEKATPKANP